MSYGGAAFGEQTFGQLGGFDAFAISSATRISAYNFCNPFDHILPIADSTISATDRAHLWGLYSGIAVGEGVGLSSHNPFLANIGRMMNRG